MIIGIRREDKNRWERRAPLTPEDVGALISEHGLAFHVQPSPIRVFPDNLYAAVGAEIREDLSTCDLVLAIKEMPLEFFRDDRAYMFFSHTIKGQPYNMALLRRLLELRATLFDYELIADERGRRLLFFGRFAGLAGMIDTLHALGKRLEHEGIASPLAAIKMAHAYADLAEAKREIAQAGEAIRSMGLDERICPLVVGFAGYGNVSLGAQEIIDLLPVRTITPEELPDLRERGDLSRHHLYKVVFKEEHMVTIKQTGMQFDLQDYYKHPEKYDPAFDKYTPHLNVLVNCIFWTEKYPRLITKDFVRKAFSAETQPHLRAIGDISCDINGSIEFTEKTTDPANPCYVYEPTTGEIRDGYAGRGPVIMAVDNLPCELPAEASEPFGRVLREYIAEFARADLGAAFDRLALSAPLKRAVVAYRGELRPEFTHLEEAMRDAGA